MHALHATPAPNWTMKCPNSFHIVPQCSRTYPPIIHTAFRRNCHYSIALQSPQVDTTTFSKPKMGLGTFFAKNRPISKQKMAEEKKAREEQDAAAAKALEELHRPDPAEAAEAADKIKAWKKSQERRAQEKEGGCRATETSRGGRGRDERGREGTIRCEERGGSRAQGGGCGGEEGCC